MTIALYDKLLQEVRPIVFQVGPRVPPILWSLYGIVALSWSDAHFDAQTYNSFPISLQQPRGRTELLLGEVWFQHITNYMMLMFHLPSFGVLTNPLTLASGSYPTGALCHCATFDWQVRAIYQLTTTQIKLQGDVTLSNTSTRVARNKGFPEVIFHTYQTFTCSLIILLAPSGALVVIMVY